MFYFRILEDKRRCEVHHVRCILVNIIDYIHRHTGQKLIFKFQVRDRRILKEMNEELNAEIIGYNINDAVHLNKRVYY